MEKEKSAGAITFRKNKETKYLLLHYESGHWDLPKGNIEANEKYEDTIKREIKEEAGIEDIIIIKDFKERVHYFYKSEGKLISKEVIFYLAETKTSKIKLSFEHTGFEWLSFKKATEKLTFKNAKDLLKKADDFLKKSQVE